MTPRTPRTLARLALPLAASLTVVACSGGGDDSADTTVPATTTTVAETTTTERETTTTEEEATTTTAALAPPAPLTGVPVTDPAVLTRPAIAVKIDNHPEAQPHAGLNQADIVYEEIVEGITRFFAIFHSTDAAPIGPVRSARTTDVDLLNQLNRPLFVWSGGNRGVVAAIGRANAESRPDGSPGFYRDQERRRRTDLEHTLMNEGTQVIWTTAVEGQGPPPQMFSYRAEGDEATGDPAATVSMRMNSVPVLWTWDDAQDLWMRETYGNVHLDTTGAQLSAHNVVVQFCDYRTSSAAAGSPEAITVGAGEAWLFSDGKVVKGTWERPDASAPAVFKDASGEPMLLTPGRTWIELAEAGDTEVTIG
jgi:hypothetical protein